MKKIRILYSGETTGAASGFGVYGLEIMKRLVNNPQFELAEFASFGSIDDGKYRGAKWRYYPNAVTQNNPEWQQYNSNEQNKFGAWRFERVLLDFKPDIVFRPADPWMCMTEHRSPLRDYYHLCVMPTVDSAPQQHDWIEMFSGADSVMLFSDWAREVLEDQSGGKIKPIATPYSGIELDCFYPSKDKAKDKAKFGLPEDSFIIGSVMRNQKRKLFEDLFMSFKVFLEKFGDTEVGKKSYLLCHTSYPDFAGWKLDKILKQYGIANRVYFTYFDAPSNHVFIRKFCGTKAFSPYTNGLTAQFPNVGRGVSREQLGDIYRCMDLYCQYAICEGLGMPQLEAAGSGVPVSAIDYSAMADVVEKTRGIPLRCSKMFYEWETNAYRAYPDNQQTADAWYEYASSNDKYKAEKQKQARQAAEKWFNWDRSAKIWSDHFQSIVLTGKQGQWDHPPAPLKQIPPFNEHTNLNNCQYVEWLCNQVAQDPDMFTGYAGLNMIDQLNNQVTSTFRQGAPTNRKQMYDMCYVVGNNRLVTEQARMNTDKLPIPDFVEFAHEFEREVKNE